MYVYIYIFRLTSFCRHKRMVWSIAAICCGVLQLYAAQLLQLHAVECCSYMLWCVAAICCRASAARRNYMAISRMVTIELYARRMSIMTDGQRTSPQTRASPEVVKSLGNWKNPRDYWKYLGNSVGKLEKNKGIYVKTLKTLESLRLF